MTQRNNWWPVIGGSLVVFMATLDTSIVAVALPAIERDFGTRTSATEWVVLGYLLPLIALTLPAGRWLDRTGPRAALLLAIAGFTLSSLAAGLAPGIGYLVAARGVQGAFAAILFAVIPSITIRAVGPGQAGRASSLFMTLGPLGAVSGPPLGGLIVQAWGWPWIFYINLPVVGPLGGYLGDRWGLARTAGAGAAIMTVGAALLIPVDAGWHAANLSWRLAVIGVGTGLLAGPSFAMLMSNAPAHLHGTAGAAQSLARQLGFSLGPALATTVWALSDYTLTGMRAAFALATVASLLAVLCIATSRTKARPITSPAERLGAEPHGARPRRSP